MSCLILIAVEKMIIGEPHRTQVFKERINLNYIFSEFVTIDKCCISKTTLDPK